MSDLRTPFRLVAVACLVIASSRSSAEDATVPPGAHAAPAAEATPQRPSLSFNTSTVPAGGLELEVGGWVTDGGSSLLGFLKYGLTRRTELELAFDAVRRVDLDDGTATSQGDVILGLRSRVAEPARGPSVALAGVLKIPTAGEEAGSGEFDARFIAIASIPSGRSSVDANLGFSAVGQEDGSTLGQVEGIVAFNFPRRHDWSPFAEVAWQTTAARGHGGYMDAGVLRSASRTGVFDFAIGAGWSDGYPDWSVTAGWTCLFNGGKSIGRSRSRPPSSGAVGVADDDR